MYLTAVGFRNNLRPSHVVFPKIGISSFFGISRKNWDFRQNIWISGARGHLKSHKKRPEIHKNARNPDFCEIPMFGKPHGKGPELQKIGVFYAIYMYNPDALKGL